MSERCCFHCSYPIDKIGSCDCVICAPYPILVAPCQACIGRRNAPPMKDPRDIRNWELIAVEAPARHYRRIRP